ncbi:hypothetical protein ACFXKY_14825 [Streptomyces canus]|uniref:hypothetical protein n=1 Tax=Streptomyces canus TaxID=58343 RepID=UPI00368CE6EA
MAPEQTFYYEFPNGSVQQRVTTEADPQHPADARLLTLEDFNSRWQEIESTQQQNKADVQAQENTRAKDAYDALIAAGYTTNVAQTLSGYTGNTLRGDN